MVFYDVLTFEFYWRPIFRDLMTRGPKTGVNPLVKTPDSSIFYVANVKQLTYFNEYALLQNTIKTANII